MSIDGEHRPDRVYLRRRGRMTAGQARALVDHADTYQLPVAALQQPQHGFSRSAPVGVEIGFGMGQALIDWCRETPDWNIIGIEVYQPGIGSAMLLAARAALANLKILEADARAALLFEPARPWLDEVRIFFPDPWPKKRHCKRRLIQPEFIAALGARMNDGALLRIATDWAPYAWWINEVLQAAPGWVNKGAADGFAPRFAERGTTRFEARGRRLGHDTWDFLYQRVW